MEANESPKPVRTGVMLLYAALGVAGLRSIVEAATNAKLLGAAFMILMLAIILVVLGVMSLLIALIGRGKNWARITMLVLFLLSLDTSILTLLRPFEPRSAPDFLGLAQLILQFVALRFLFHREASFWFCTKAKRGERAAPDGA